MRKALIFSVVAVVLSLTSCAPIRPRPSVAPLPLPGGLDKNYTVVPGSGGYLFAKSLIRHDVKTGQFICWADVISVAPPRISATLTFTRSDSPSPEAKDAKPMELFHGQREEIVQLRPYNENINVKLECLGYGLDN